MSQLSSGDIKVQIGVTVDERLTIEEAEGLIILRAQNMQNEPKSQNWKNQTKIVKNKDKKKLLISYL